MKRDVVLLPMLLKKQERVIAKKTPQAFRIE